ncbi:hypothetical protein BCEP4_320031 [Burkholderia cepacia]|nr:hypothetical protein BCEP4_320031 [Burkholderia cepacia]
MRNGRLGKHRLSRSISGLAIVLRFATAGPGSPASVAMTCRHIAQAAWERMTHADLTSPASFPVAAGESLHAAVDRPVARHERRQSTAKPHASTDPD